MNNEPLGHWVIGSISQVQFTSQNSQRTFHNWAPKTLPPLKGLIHLRTGSTGAAPWPQSCAATRLANAGGCQPDWLLGAALVALGTHGNFIDRFRVVANAGGRGEFLPIRARRAAADDIECFLLRTGE